MRILDDKRFRTKVIINVAVLIISLFNIAKETPNVSTTTGFDRFMVDSLSPIQSGLTNLKHGIAHFFQDYVVNVNASERNRELMKKIDDLNNEIFAYNEIAKENVRLKELLQFGEQVKYNKILVQIVGWDASGDYKSLRINKGSNDGIRLQSIAVTSDGLVGYVYRLTNNFADVLTILDINNKVDGIIERTRTHGVVEGRSRQHCFMKYVTRTEPIQLNDLVLTSGLGNVFPKGLKVGNVTRISRDSYGITQDVEITPSVDFSRLEELIIFVNDSQNKISEEWKALDSTDDSKAKNKKARK